MLSTVHRVINLRFPGAHCHTWGGGGLGGGSVVLIMLKKLPVIAVNHESNATLRTFDCYPLILQLDILQGQ